MGFIGDFFSGNGSGGDTDYAKLMRQNDIVQNSTGLNMNLGQVVQDRMNAPQAQNQFRDQQMGLAQSLSQQANGQGPSIADAQLHSAMDRNAANQMGLLSSQRGVNAGMALRTGAQNLAQGNQSLADQAANARIQEQMSARNQLGGVLQAGRGQDLQNQQMLDQYQQSMYNLGNQRDLANVSAGEKIGDQQNEAANRRQKGNNQLMSSIQGLAGSFMGAPK